MKTTAATERAAALALDQAQIDWETFLMILEELDKNRPEDGPAMRWSQALEEFRSHKGKAPLFDESHAWQHHRPAMVQFHAPSQPCLPIRPSADALAITVQEVG